MAEKNSTAISRDFQISRTFDVPRELLWRIFTECKHLKHWWGPKGFKISHCEADLRPGGIFHYALQSPDGFTMWGKFVYREVVAPEHFTCIVSFSDEMKGITRHPMNPTWPREILATNTFTEEGGRTTVTIRWSPHNATPEELKTFEEGQPSIHVGFGGTFENLTAYLATKPQ